MEYEYKSIFLGGDKCVNEVHNQILNDHFAQGWEYVDSICQCISTGNQYEVRGNVIVIFRKKVAELKI